MAAEPAHGPDCYRLPAGVRHHSRHPWRTADPYPQHPTLFSIPLIDVHLDPARETCFTRVLVKHERYHWLMLAESHLTRRLFGAMVGRIAALLVATG